MGGSEIRSLELRFLCHSGFPLYGIRVVSLREGLTEKTLSCFKLLMCYPFILHSTLLDLATSIPDLTGAQKSGLSKLLNVTKDQGGRLMALRKPPCFLHNSLTVNK